MLSRDTPALRGQRHAFVAPSSHARSHVLECDFMVTEMTAWWGSEPVEVATFTSIGDAPEWGSGSGADSEG